MWKHLPPRQRRFLAAWVVGLLVLFTIITLVSLAVVGGERRASQRSHEARMTPGVVEPGLTPPDPVPATGDFATVMIGLYVDNIDSLSIRDSNWSATFYAWFRWEGAVALDPARSFQVVDARIDKREVVDSYSTEAGTHYQRVRVTARFSKYFNTTRVPLDDHLLTIRIEDAARDVTRLRYVLDPASNVSSRVKIPGYEVIDHQQVIKHHTYRSSYGDPRLDDGPAGGRGRTGAKRPRPNE